MVSSFTQEELARLLQFTTGSSQLPPGGFAALCPSFQIIAAPTHSTLPTAHTWQVSWGGRTFCIVLLGMTPASCGEQAVYNM